jgi:hypothetical protein
MAERASWTLRYAENRPIGIGQNEIPATGPYREEGGVPLPARTALSEPPAAASTWPFVIPPTRPTPLFL